MVVKHETCFLCDGPANVHGPVNMSGKFLGIATIDCSSCTRYRISPSVDLADLRALTGAQKAFLAGKARKNPPSDPLIVNTAAIAFARTHA